MTSTAHYIVTPWRDTRELLSVRQQFFPYPPVSLADRWQRRIQTAKPGKPKEVPQGSSRSQTKKGIVAEGQSDARLPKRRRVHEGGETIAPKPQTKSSSPGRGAADSDSDVEMDEVDEEVREMVAKRRAIERVSMWMRRGGCPVLVESTALLMSAIMSDEEAVRGVPGDHGTSRGSSNPSYSGSPLLYAVRAAYTAAFSRFVTGLLDSLQESRTKQSMFQVASEIGLPSTFVELRHQATHEHLPSLARLRVAARDAIVWIWKYYWLPLGDYVPGAITARDLPTQRMTAAPLANSPSSNKTSPPVPPSTPRQPEAHSRETFTREDLHKCRDALRICLSLAPDGSDFELSSLPPSVQRVLQRWGLACVVQGLALLMDEDGGEPETLVVRTWQKHLAALKQQQEEEEWQQEAARGAEDVDQRVSVDALSEETTDDQTSATSKKSIRGWKRYSGPWQTKPIGMV